jgi:hypothetical protein
VKYVGRAPNNDASLVTAGWVDTRHTALAVNDAYISASIAAYAASAPLETPSYVDANDALRATTVAVDAADATCVALSQVGAANGVASLDGSLYVPSGQLPDLVLSRPVTYVPASTIWLTSEVAISATATKTFKAAEIVIDDPGYDYRPLPFAYVRGRSQGSPGHSRRRGGDSAGRLTILSAADDALFGGGRTDTCMSMTSSVAIPTAPTGTVPSVVSGDLTLQLWLAMLNGTSYYFNPEGFSFFAMVFPAI